MEARRKTTFNWKEGKTLALHFLLGGGAISLMFSWHLLAQGQWLYFLAGWALNGILWVAIGWGNGMLVEWLDRRLSWLEAPVKRLLVSLGLTMAYSLGVAVLIYIGFAVLYYGASLTEALNDMGVGFLISVGLITLIVSLFLHGRGFWLAWKTAFMEAEQHKQAALKAKYEALKNQVNPHFLFNSFNVLSTLVHKDPDLAAQFIEQLSKVYRYVLDTREQELVPLSQELVVLDAYLFLLKIRFGDALEIEQSVEAEAEEAIVPLTLQMLAENAVKHNIVSRNRPLYLRISRSQGRIQVENNRQIKHNDQESIGVGLPNLQERYRFLCGQELEVEDSEAAFRVTVPIVQLTLVA